jgi:CheY-like chemotaxis protein
MDLRRPNLLRQNEGPKTILCIDDELEILRLRRKLLETHGFKVLTALSGDQGLRMLSESPVVDLVLLDFAMSQRDGAQVAEELKSLYPHVPIIAVSGYPELPEAFREMVDGFVQKGQEPEDLVGAINRTLNSRR